MAAQETKLHKLSKDIDLAKSVCQKRYFNLEMMRVERKKLTQRMRQIKIQVTKRKEEKQLVKVLHYVFVDSLFFVICERNFIRKPAKLH